MAESSDVLYSLKPVTFKYRKDIDPAGVPEFGLVAEDVDKISHDLVARDDNGQIFTVRYEAVNAMLLNEFLKEHQRVTNQAKELQDQEKQLAVQGNTIASQQAQIDTLTAGLAAMQRKIAQEAATARPRTASVTSAFKEGENVAELAPAPNR